jgi:hypothetical protein
MPRRPTKLDALRNPTSEGGSDIQKFLVRELPPKNSKHASYFANALRSGERYDRYIARRDEWIDYATRKNKLEGVTALIEGVASGLAQSSL